MENNTILIGLPSTGKSSFIAALYHYILSDVSGKTLTQYQLSDDAEYLNKIRETWLKCQIQQRTSLEKRYNHNAVMFIEDTSTHDQLKLNIPDLAGEVFQSHWQDRSMELDYKSLIKDAFGIIFFISPSNIKPHVLISNVKDASLEFLDGLTDENEDTKQSSFEEESAKWIHNEVPTQVRLVELLQIHLDEMNQIMPVPIMFVISAWDTQISESEPISPAKWLELNLPLLHQFIISNNEQIEYDIIGISAQGGDYSQQDVLVKLRNQDEPAERVKVTKDGISYSTDIAMPIHWIIQKWKEIKR